MKVEKSQDQFDKLVNDPVLRSVLLYLKNLFIILLHNLFVSFLVENNESLKLV